MRYFTLLYGGHSEKHSHSHEHLVNIESGKLPVLLANSSNNQFINHPPFSKSSGNLY